MSRGGVDEKSGWRSANTIAAPSAIEVETMLSAWLNGRRVRDVRLLAGGLMNRNCQVHIDGAARAVVLRLYDRDSAACAREVAVLERLRGDMPVPEVLYADTTAGDGRPPFVVLEFVEGLSLRELKQTGDRTAIAEAAYDAGRLLARLQGHRFTRVGMLGPALTVESSSTVNPITMTGLIELFGTSPSFSRRVDVILHDRILRLAHEWDEWTAVANLGPTLVHGDFNSRNILVRRRAATWSVVAILDWEFAFSGSVYSDIGNFLRYERAAQPRFEPSFSRGCRDGGVNLREHWLIAARVADLAALCDFLARASTPDEVATEVLGLVHATLDEHDSR